MKLADVTSPSDITAADPGQPARIGPRTRGEIDRERAALIEDADREIDRIAAEFHAALPRERARQIGVAYARYSSRFQHSIVDQVRGLFEAALKLGAFIPREAVCYDLAVPGYKDKRPGLNRLRALVAGRGADVFLVYATSRLFRKTYKAMQFVEEEVVGRGIRCIFVKSGVDSDDARRWRLLLQMNAMTDEFIVGMYSDNVRSAHEGLFEAGLVFGTIPFGYRGRPIPGPLTKRGRPRCVLEVDAGLAPWVGRAFAWFVDDRLTIGEIARRFNDDLGIPPSPRSLSGLWGHKSIRYLLTNARYRGVWEYGKTVSTWQDRQDYARQIPRAEALKSIRWEGLRLVSEETWFAAQRLLEGRPRPAGREPVDGDRGSRPLLLNGLFFCPEHDRPLYVGGPFGRSMFCKDCKGTPTPIRPLFTQLNRALALSMTCRALAELVRGDDGLAARVVAACREEAARGQRADPDRIDVLRREVLRLSRNIAFLSDNPGESAVDRVESAGRLRGLRRSRTDVAAELTHREAERDRPVPVPAEEEVRRRIDELGTILERAAAGDSVEDARDARQVIELLTAGRIDLEQCGERKAQRGWLRGRFRPRLIALMATRAAGVDVRDDESAEVVIDYLEPTEAEALGDRVKSLYDRGMLIKEVAAELRISTNLATRALARWHERRGLEAPDGRSRRKSLEKKHVEPPKYVRLADEAKRLSDEGLLMGEIGERLDLDPTTLARAIAYWHESRGLPVPDGRARRKTLERKCARPYPERRRDHPAEPPAA